MATKHLLIAIAVVGVVLFAPGAEAQQRIAGIDVVGEIPQPSLATGRVPEPAWGIDQVAVSIHAGLGFVPYRGTEDVRLSDGTVSRTGGSSIYFDHNVDLPAGAEIVFVELAGCDESATAHIEVFLLGWFGISGSGADFLANPATTDEGTPGCGYFIAAVTHPERFVNKYDNRYLLRLAITGTTSETRVGEVRIYYKLRVSPPPAIASFGDVPVGHPLFQYVEALAASGITAGCGGGDFCPNAPLTRGQMAVFLSKALGLHFPY